MTCAQDLVPSDSVIQKNTTDKMKRIAFRENLLHESVLFVRRKVFESHSNFEEGEIWKYNVVHHKFGSKIRAIFTWENINNGRSAAINLLAQISPW